VSILDRYIGRVVLLGTLMSLFILMTLIGFILLVDELGDVGEGNYQLLDAVLFVSLNMPGVLFQLFPIAAMLGSLMGLGALANHSELTAMRAAGVSLARITASVLQMGAILMIVAFLVGEFLAPWGERKALTLRAEKISGTVSMESQYGFWARDGDAFINIRKILSGNQLQDIYIYEFDKSKRMTLSTHAERANYVDDGWRLQNIVQTQYSEGRAFTRKVKEANWQSLLNPDLLKVVIIESKFLPIWELYEYINFLKSNGQSAVKYEIDFWNKVLTPFVTLVMMLLAIPFVFGSTRSTSMGQRVFAGVLVAAGFHMLNTVFGYISLVYGLNSLFAAAFPGLLFLGVAIVLFRRVH